jgi:hypothetical protein
VLLLQHPRQGGGLISVIGEGVPAAEDQLVKPGQGDELLYLRYPVLGAFAEADGAELGE